MLSQIEVVMLVIIVTLSIINNVMAILLCLKVRKSDIQFRRKYILSGAK